MWQLISNGMSPSGPSLLMSDGEFRRDNWLVVLCAGKASARGRSGPVNLRSRTGYGGAVSSHGHLKRSPPFMTEHSLESIQAEAALFRDRREAGTRACSRARSLCPSDETVLWHPRQHWRTKSRPVLSDLPDILSSLLQQTSSLILERAVGGDKEPRLCSLVPSRPARN